MSNTKIDIDMSHETTKQLPTSVWYDFVFYFTNINLLLVLFSKYTHPYINLLFTCTFVLFGGLYISYINPGYFYFIDEFGNAHSIDAYKKFYIDVLFHILPLIYIYITYNDYYSTNPGIITAIIIIILYLCTVKIENIYKTDENVIGFIFITIVLFYSFYNKIL